MKLVGTGKRSDTLRRLCAVFGLTGQPVHSITIRVAVDERATATIERDITVSELDDVVAALPRESDD